MRRRHRISNLSRKTVGCRRVARKRTLERLRNQILIPQPQKSSPDVMELCELCGFNFPSFLELNLHSHIAHQVELDNFELVDEAGIYRPHSNSSYRRSKKDKNQNLNTKGCIFEKRFGAERGAQMLENLLDEVACKDSMKMKILDENYNFVISVVTPFMLRVHEKLKQSSEVVFMNFMGPYDPLGCKILLLMTNSFAGRLPLAVMVMTSVTAEAITHGLRMILELVSDASFGGRGKKGPILFLIKEDSEAISKSLNNVLPSSRLLFCQCRTVASMRSHLAKRSGIAHSAHKCALLDMFKSLVFENDLNVFHRKVKEILYDDVALLYPQFREYLLDILRTESHWAACHRTDIITRGQNTNIICPESSKVFNDAIGDGIPSSPVHILKVITENYEKYYIDKLSQIAHHRVSNHLLSKWSKVQRKCDRFVHFADVGKVFDPDHNRTYVIDLESYLCSCSDGIDGKVCEHLYLALRNNDTGMLLTFPQSKSERKTCFYIATGKYLSDESLADWFKCPLQPEPYFQTKVINEVMRAPKDASDSMENLMICEQDGVPEETIFVNVSIDADYDDDGESSYGRTLRELDNVFVNLKTRILENPSLCASATEMVSSYKNISTLDTLESALLSFAKKSSNLKQHQHYNEDLIRKLQNVASL